MRFLVIAALVATSVATFADEPSQQSPACQKPDRFFQDEVWVKVGQRTCLKCHNETGDAADSDFILKDTARDWRNRQELLDHNRAAFVRMAKATDAGKSRLLQKIVGGLDHGGGEVLKRSSVGAKLLLRFEQHVTRKTPALEKNIQVDEGAFFDGLVMSSPKKLLRRVTLSLAGRLPTSAEQQAVASKGMDAFPELLSALMKEDAFYHRLKEAFEDILLTRGYMGNPELALSYDHFEKSRLWFQKLHPGKDENGKNYRYDHPKMVKYYKLVRDYREAMLREPSELIEYIVRNDRPFTEIVTADYTMLSPYTARGYGVLDDIRDRFDDVDDPFEFIPYTIPALKNRSGKTQESKTGRYPHAGLLTSFQYMMRYPTTETNRNRLRVRMYFQHFLGIDILKLAPRVSDAAKLTTEYEVPTMQASDCTVCHKIIDPIAGLYQDYYVVDAKGVFGPRKEGWFKDMFGPGHDREKLPVDQRWRSLQWLGERTAKDPRFATAMVEHVWYTLAGRRPLLPPEDIDSPAFAAKYRAFKVQRAEIERVASEFIRQDFNLKVVFRELALSKLYRVDAVSASEQLDPQRLAELDDIGVVRMLTPEQLERKIAAIFGTQRGHYNRLTDREAKLKILYGGIDSKEVTNRNTDPSGAMGAIQRIVSNQIPCKHTAHDFSLPPDKRRLFPMIEIDVLPGASTEGDDQIRKTIVHLHKLLLGRDDKLTDPEVHRTFGLFAGVIADAEAHGFDPRESYHCQTQREVTPRDADPHYTIRAWRAVLTYLMRQHEFLYE